MGWRHVLFANWPVDPSIVDERTPDALSVDTCDGRAWLSVVPFTNVAVRPHPLPAALGHPLPELNLRTYVERDGEPAVYFFSLDANRILDVVGARLFHSLPYYYARIAVDVDGGDLADLAPGEVRFESRRRHPGARPVRFAATYGPSGDRFAAGRGSLAAFLTERHRYYTESPAGELRYAEVYHDPWPLYPATATIEENTLFEADGFDRPDGDPLCYYSPGVDTLASRSRRARDPRGRERRW
jgi:hypothetical protein